MIKKIHNSSNNNIENTFKFYEQNLQKLFESLTKAYSHYFKNQDPNRQKPKEINFGSLIEITKTIEEILNTESLSQANILQAKKLTKKIDDILYKYNSFIETSQSKDIDPAKMHTDVDDLISTLVSLKKTIEIAQQFQTHKMEWEQKKDKIGKDNPEFLAEKDREHVLYGFLKNKSTKKIDIDEIRNLGQRIDKLFDKGDHNKLKEIDKLKTEYDDLAKKYNSKLHSKAYEKKVTTEERKDNKPR